MIKYTFTAEYLKKQIGRNQADFIRKAGYKNVSKGMRRMNAFFSSGEIEVDLLERIRTAASGESYFEKLNELMSIDAENDRDEKEAIKNRKDLERRLLFNHRLFLIKNIDLILSTPEYAFCEILGAHYVWMYFGGGDLTLASLLLVWKEYETSKLINKCSKCGGRNLPISGGGSVLSGSSWISGFCSECEEVQSWHGGFLHPARNAFLALKNKYPDGCEKPLPLKQVLRELGASGEDLIDHDDDTLPENHVSWSVGKESSVIGKILGF